MGVKHKRSQSPTLPYIQSQLEVPFYWNYVALPYVRNAKNDNTASFMYYGKTKLVLIAPLPPSVSFSVDASVKIKLDSEITQNCQRWRSVWTRLKKQILAMVKQTYHRQNKALHLPTTFGKLQISSPISGLDFIVSFARTLNHNTANYFSK